MAHRVLTTAATVVLPAILLAPLAAPTARAGEPPALPAPRGADGGLKAEPRWPAELQHRNARYASLTRVDDSEGDLRVRLMAHLQTARVDDRLGDFEEVRRKRAAEHVPPRAILYAQVRREGDLDGDTREEVLASIRNERRFAETRRFRDLGGDSEQLAIHRRAVRERRIEQEDRIVHATERQTRLPIIDRRDDEAAVDRRATPRDLERVDEHDFEKLEDRDRGLGGDEDRWNRTRDMDDRDDRDRGGREDRDEDRDLDRIEEANEKSADLRQDRLLERQQELQNEREEANAPGGS
ncbi:MAG: hypothetical protein M9894_05295 [Planctomycetes bacterium]|nr:hypothetical protein [Planctomycetota bacterium]